MTITVELRQGGTISRESADGIDSAQHRAVEWCSGWNVRTQVCVLDDGGCPLFAAANNDRDAANLGLAGVTVRRVD